MLLGFICYDLVIYVHEIYQHYNSPVSQVLSSMDTVEVSNVVGVSDRQRGEELKGFIKKIIAIFIENSGTFIHTKVLNRQKRCRSFLRSFKTLDYLATHIFT